MKRMDFIISKWTCLDLKKENINLDYKDGYLKVSAKNVVEENEDKKIYSS